MPNIRRYFPYLMVVLVVCALGWAVSFGTLPRADFTFINGTEIESIDPAIVSGQPEGRIIWAVLEGAVLRFAFSHRHRRFDVWVGVVVFQFKILELEVEDRAYVGVYPHRRQRARVTR